MSDQPQPSERRIDDRTPDAPESGVGSGAGATKADIEAKAVAREYLTNAPGETTIERAANAADQAGRDAQEAREQIEELHQIANRATLAADVLDGIKRRAIDDVADTVLSTEVAASTDEQPHASQTPAESEKDGGQKSE